MFQTTAGQGNGGDVIAPNLYELAVSSKKIIFVFMTAIHIKLYDLLRKDLKNEKQNLSTKEDICRLKLKIEQSKNDLYKAMFWTNIVQLLAILGGVMAIVKFVS